MAKKTTHPIVTHEVTTASLAHAKERLAFKTLLATNPNYFGNLAESPWKPVLPINYNTYYEELACVGYHPQQEKLEAVIFVKQPSGYGTGLCGAGTTEYVRFYLSHDHGASWVDEGMTSFQVWNVPEGTEGARRLEYAATLAIDPARKFCTQDPLIRVRAILSWNDPPPAGQPDWIPVWGNRGEAVIQVEALRLIPLPHLFDLYKIKLPAGLADMLDLETPVPVKKKTLSAADLAALYQDKNLDVPAHRFAYKELMAFTSGKTTLSATGLAQLLPKIKLDPGIVDILMPQADGDTRFEELCCVGLDPNLPDTLVGVIRVKKSSGYSGGLCSTGSREYVTFWADIDANGSYETCLGTAEVRVYDLPGMPAEGVHYAVRLPVNLEPYRQACKAGPRLIGIRAILSWNVPAPCANPNHVPAWGNREETVILVNPATAAPAGKIAILGGIPVVWIDNASGLTTPDARFATNNLPPDDLDANPATPGRPCPFAGRVTAQGAPLAGHYYVVEVSPDGAVWTPVLTDLLVTDQDGVAKTHKADPVSKRFAYLPFEENINGVLAQWDSSGNAKWQVRLSTYDSDGNLVGQDGHVVQLDNSAPEVSIKITGGAGSCGKFVVGTVLTGSYVVRDDYLGHYSLGIEPAVNPPGAAQPSPASGTVNTAGAGAAWSLDTAQAGQPPMKPCGYVIRITAVDRAIVNSQSVGHWSSASDGFCLEKG